MGEQQPAGIAFIQLAMATASVEAFRDSLEQEPAASPLRQLAAAHPEAWHVVHAVLATIDHEARSADAASHIGRVAAMFDRALAISPEASVALYSLGDAKALEQATTEIADWLAAEALLGADSHVLDIGCGIGRLESVLAGRARWITGIDIAPAMVAEARRRCAGLANVTILETGGADLAPFGDGSFELVIALDSFPYVVTANGDLAGRLIAEASRVLATGGHLVILNYAYEDEPERQAQDVRRLGQAAGLVLREAGTQPFASWDGRAFLLAKP